MSKNKPRTYPDKPQNHYCDSKCPYDDGTVWKECNHPWTNKCDGNRYNCHKLYFQFLATLAEKKRQEFIDKYGDRITTPHTNL